MICTDYKKYQEVNNHIGGSSRRVKSPLRELKFTSRKINFPSHVSQIPQNFGQKRSSISPQRYFLLLISVCQHKVLVWNSQSVMAARVLINAYSQPSNQEPAHCDFASARGVVSSNDKTSGLKACQRKASQIGLSHCKGLD